METKNSASKKFVPPNCTRFGGMNADGKIICRFNDAFMLVPPGACHCAEMYRNRFDRRKNGGIDAVRKFVEGERLRMEGRKPEFFSDYFSHADGISFLVERGECVGGVVWLVDEANGLNVCDRYVWTTHGDAVVASELFNEETRETLVQYFRDRYEES